MTIFRMASRLTNEKKADQCLNVEALEERMMLSTVEIFAAGATGQENLDLFIDGQLQQTFFSVGGDASIGQFRRLTFETDQPLTPGSIGVGFSNDKFDASTGLDRNLFVDRIVVDGVSVEAEDPSTFSTGIYRDGLTGPGFLETDVLNINGVLTFADPASIGGGGGSGDRIEFDAFGTTGEEFVDIFVNGESVAFFGLDTPGVTQTFSFTSDDSNISIEDVRLEFVNDLFDESRGIDRNVQIFEFRVIDGETGAVESARTTDANVLNTGIFVDGIGITEGFGAGGFLATNGFVEISDTVGGGASSIVSDSDFQITEGSFSFDPAIGPDDQIASSTTGNEIQVVGSNGVPLSSFAGDGSVDLDDLLSLPSGFELNVTDLEFFDDGSLLVTGFTEEIGAGVLFGQGPATPVIAKLSPDGTLDGSFTQQGFLQGTFLQLPDNGSPVLSVIDSSGRIIVFGANNDNPDPFGDPLNFIVARLNPDGTPDPTFGNSGNVFVQGSSFPDVGGPFASGTPLGVDVLDNGDITFAFSFPGFAGSAQTLVVSRLSASGDIDRGFGSNGFFVRTLGTDPGAPLFQQTPSGGAAIAFTSDADVTTLLLLDSAGDQFAETPLVIASEILLDGAASTPFTSLSDLAVDQAGNIVVTTFRTPGGFTSLPNVIQRVLPSGEVDTGFGVDGSAILGFTGATDIIFDSEDRLVVVGADRTRFDFV